MTADPWKIAVWLIASLMCLIVVRNVLVAGMNPDDLRALSYDMVYPIHNFGRWLGHVISNNIGTEMVKATIPQLAIAFALCVWTSLMLGKKSAETNVWFAAGVIFVFGTAHAYFAEIVHFNEFILANVLCFAASLWAFDRIVARRASLVMWALSTQIVALALAVYPTYFLLGAYLPLLMLIRADRFTLRDCLAALARGIVLSGLGLALYAVQYRIANGLITFYPTMAAVEGFSTDATLGKLGQLPHVVQWVHSSALSNVGSRWVRLLFLVLSFAVFLSVMVAALIFAWRRPAPERTLIILRVVCAMIGVLVVLPTFFWLLYPMAQLPGRALGFYGFILGSLLVSAHTQMGSQVPGRTPVALALALTFASLGAFQSWKTADIDAVASRRDDELSREIHSRLLELEDFDGDYVNIVGGIVYEDLRWGRYRATTNYEPGNEFNAALSRFIELKRWPIHVPVGPEPCPAFPSDGSVYADNGVAYVCLEARETGWKDGACAVLGGPGGEVCFGTGYVAFLGQICRPGYEDTGMVEVIFRDDTGQPMGIVDVLSDYVNATGVGGSCGFFGDTDVPEFHDAVLTGYFMDGHEAWKHVIAAEALQHTSP